MTRPLTSISWLTLSKPLLVASAALWITGAGCGKSESADPTDTNTQWLKSCEESADCSGAFSCLCGVCTRSCAEDSECSGLSEVAVCATPDAECSALICTESPPKEPPPPSGEDSGSDPLEPQPSQDSGPNPAPPAADASAGAPSTSPPDASTQAGQSTWVDASVPAATPSDGGVVPDDATFTSKAPFLCEWGSFELDVCTAEQACCTCGCGADSDSCLNESACPPPLVGTECGVRSCQTDEICCSAERSLCAPDQATCNAVLDSFEIPGADHPSSLELELSAQLTNGIGCCDFYGIIYRDRELDYCVFAEFRMEVGHDGVLSQAYGAQPADACSFASPTLEGAIEATDAHGFAIINFQASGVPLIDTWFTASFDGVSGLPMGLRIAREGLPADGMTHPQP